MDAPSLRNISITVGQQQLLAVIGPVGAGKVSRCRCFHQSVGTECVWVCVTHIPSLLPQSSLLSAILGELAHESGTLQVKGEVSYAAQQPWVFPGTIRSNILFGREMNPAKYETVLKVCALKRVS